MNNKARVAKALVLILTLALAIYIFKNYAEAVADGMFWKTKSDWAMIAPNHEEKDLRRARKINDFALKDHNGRLVHLSQFQPFEVLLVNLWSTGCPPCQRELPSLAELDRRLSSLGKVALLTITVDENWDEVAHYFPQGTDLRILFDPEKKVVGEMFGTTKFPETFILDKQRRIRARFDGERDWHSPEMLNYIKSFF